ncbi:tripartite tricarboxylate transporter substrate binding protein [Comamonadaceae bacterium PP-2]
MIHRAFAAPRRHFNGCALAAVASISGLLACSPAVAAEDIAAWPSKPVKLIVHSTAGGASDVQARLLADGLRQKWGQPVIIDNRAGANGLIATQALKAAPADGYTLMQTATGPVAMNVLMHGKAYDPAQAFAAIAPVASTYMIVVAGVNQPYDDLAGLAAYSKATPGKVSYASAGVGAVPHIGTEFVNLKLDGGLTHVPYRGESQFIPDLLSGTVSSAMMIAGSALPLIKSGKLKPLAVTASRRSPALPDVKTLDEQGVGATLPLWWGFIAPTGTPPAILDKVNRDLREVLADPALRKRYADMVLEVPPESTPAQFQASMVDEAAKWADMVRKTRITLTAE